MVLNLSIKRAEYGGFVVETGDKTYVFTSDDTLNNWFHEEITLLNMVNKQILTPKLSLDDLRSVFS